MIRKRSVTRLFVSCALYSLAANFAHPVTPTFIQELGLNDYMFGVAFAAMSLSNFLFSPFWGKIAHNFGPVKIMGVCYMGYGVAQLMFGLSQSEIAIVCARLIGGFFIGGITVEQIVYIMDNSDGLHLSQNLAINVTITAVVSAFGYMIGGFLGDISIMMTFIIQAVGLASVGAYCLLFIADNDDLKTKVRVSEIIKNSNPFKAFVDARNIITVTIVIYLAVAVFTAFASTAYDQCFNYFIKDHYGFAPSYNGLIKASVGIISLIANATICSYLLKKTDIKKTIIPVLMICFILMNAIILIEDVGTFIVTNVIFFGFNAVYQPLLQAEITFVKNDDGTVVGLYNSMRSLGNVGGSLIAGLIYGYGAKLSFVLSAVSFLIAIVFSFLFYRRMKDPAVKVQRGV